MGEYAKVNGTQVKIGTCEDMMYLRFEDRDLCRPIPGNVDIRNDSIAAECFFRLPYPDEDGKGPGGEPDRGLRLYRTVTDESGRQDWAEDFADPDLEPGTLQMTHGSGLLLNVPCHHGAKLPDVGPARALWNGKIWSLELSRLRCVSESGRLRLYPVVRCRWCRKMWRYDWSDIMPYLTPDWQARMARYV